MSSIVGFVFQDPETQFVVDTVEGELAFAMENHNLPPLLMRKRVEEVLDQLNIAHLRNREVSTLSGGEKQRVAICRAMIANPRIIVADEPTANLDVENRTRVMDLIGEVLDRNRSTFLMVTHDPALYGFFDRRLDLGGAS